MVHVQLWCRRLWGCSHTSWKPLAVLIWEPSGVTWGPLLKIQSTCNSLKNRLAQAIVVSGASGLCEGLWPCDTVDEDLGWGVEQTWP